MTIRPVSAYADDEPPLDPPTEEDVAARRKWADHHVAALRRERKVKPGKAAKLLGISRQRLHIVEHATKPLRCMDRLLAKAAMVWPVVDETAKGDDDASK